jgi:Fe-S-cluster containining protein
MDRTRGVGYARHVSDPLHELERQVERGNLFAHSAMSEQAVHVNENAALLNGLVGLLVQHGVVSADELMAVVDSARTMIENSEESARINVVIRNPETGSEHDGGPVDCAARIPVCKAVCCRLRFALSIEEIDNGPLKWDLGRPYYNRISEDGYCEKFDRESRGCGVYEQRPTPCRGYSCEGDDRIWTDFEGMVLNTEWIEEHLGVNSMSPVEVFMRAVDNEPKQ